MEKLYIIREVIFIHNDLENIATGLGDVVGVFDEYDQAYEAYLHCERYKHQHGHISSFELTQTEGEGLLEKMQYFFQKNFSIINDFKEMREMPTLPAEATLAQTAEFLKLSGLQYYDLSAHEQMPTYYKIKMADDFWGEEEELPFTVFPTEVDALYVLQESQEKAIHEALGVAFSYLWQDMLEETNAPFAGLQGTLTKLSKTPDVLEDYLHSCQHFLYNDKKQKICFSSEVENDETASILKELRGLFALLTRKPFAIIPIDLEAMRNKVIQIEKV